MVTVEPLSAIGESTTFTRLPSSRRVWVGEIKDKRLQEGLEKLSDEELRLITLYFRDEYSTVELSKVYGIAQQNISKRILKITKFLKKFGFLGVD